MYVKEKNLDTNEVILCDNNELFSKELYATDINLITCDKIDKPIKVKARVRYSQPEKDAIVEQIDDNTLHIVFDEPQRAISKGQAAVFYDGECSLFLYGRLQIPSDSWQTKTKSTLHGCF